MSSNLEHVTTSVLLIDANKAARAFYADGLKRCTPGYLIIEAGDAQTARQISGCVRVDKQDSRDRHDTKFRKPRTPNRRPSHQSRFSRQSRPARLSQASAIHMLVPPHRSGRLGS